MQKERAKNNRTLTLSEEEIPALRAQLLTEEDFSQDNNSSQDQNCGDQNSLQDKNFGSQNSLQGQNSGGSDLANKVANKILNGDIFKMLPRVPDNFADLIIIDPPYNLSKNFGGLKFAGRSEAAYDEYLASWFPAVCKKLKANGSLYICGDWKCSSALQRAVEKELTVMNRITWQREKGRGAKSNWKNGMEDIWFAVKNPADYYFDVDAVKLKRKVLAPYRIDGMPKDWERAAAGNFRLTHPSNFWDDISVPFWSMPENTDHPTQKPEKLYAKLVLASCPKGGMVFDPFLGSGTSAVVAKKLGRNFCGIEINEEYCLWAQKRLDRAESDRAIQGYEDGVFWERNSLAEQSSGKNRSKL